MSKMGELDMAVRAAGDLSTKENSIINLELSKYGLLLLYDIACAGYEARLDRNIEMLKLGVRSKEDVQDIKENDLRVLNTLFNAILDN